MDKESEKIIIVIGEYSHSGTSKAANFGDDYGEKYPFTKYTVAKSPEEGITQVEQNFREGIRLHNEATGKIRNKLEKTEKVSLRDRIESRLMGAQSGGPMVPRDIEKWKAEELTIPGYRIVLEKTS